MIEKLIKVMVIVVLSGLLFPTCFPQKKGGEMKVVMIIAHDGFRDEELLKPKQVLEEAGIKVVIASTNLLPARGMLGVRVTPDLKINEVKVENFDAIIFVGGVGASCYWDNSLAHQLAKRAVELNKIVAAICIAPVTLANSGILTGKNATVWPSEADRLKSKGAIYTGKPVEKDGNIITAAGPTAAEEFGKEILKALQNKE